jgi:hypothetical protein
VLPGVAVVAADHVASADFALDAADAAVDGLLVFLIAVLGLDRLCWCLDWCGSLLAALAGLALRLRGANRLVQVSVPVVALVGAARAACFVCRQSVSSSVFYGRRCARRMVVRGAQSP